MKKLILTFVVSLVAVLTLVAATKGDMPPKAKAGAVQVATYDGGSVSADGGITPTKVFTGLVGRNAFGVYNNGPVTIYCGWTSTVTPSTGFPVPAASSLSVDLVYNSTGDQDLYCVAGCCGRDQDAPLDTRWIQIK